MHQRYGNVVRIAPNELSFAGLENIKDIYGHGSRLLKPKSLDDAYAGKYMFKMRDRNEHRERRRLLSHAFSPTQLNEATPLVMDRIEALCRQLARQVGQDIDILQLSRRLSLDIIGFLFGIEFGALDSDLPIAYFTDMDNWVPSVTVQSLLPTIVYNILRQYGTPWLKSFLSTEDRIHEYGAKICREYLARYGRQSQRKDLISKMVTETLCNQSSITDLDISYELADFIFAGTNMPSLTLTYFLWSIARDETLQENLHHELRGFSKSLAENVDHASMQNSSLLTSMINEVLRCYPPAPTGFSREPPAGGAEVGEVVIPEGSIVSAQMYTALHDPVAFPHPDKFDAYRQFTTPSSREMFIPFSIGRRSCIGMNLAIHEVKLAAGTIVERFHVGLSRGIRDEDMDLRSHSAAYPKGKKCKLVFQIRG